MSFNLSHLSHKVECFIVTEGTYLRLHKSISSMSSFLCPPDLGGKLLLSKLSERHKAYFNSWFLIRTLVKMCKMSVSNLNYNKFEYFVDLILKSHGCNRKWWRTISSMLTNSSVTFCTSLLCLLHCLWGRWGNIFQLLSGTSRVRARALVHCVLALFPTLF